jgi:hypothetical protein
VLRHLDVDAAGDRRLRLRRLMNGLDEGTAADGRGSGGLRRHAVPEATGPGHRSRHHFDGRIIVVAALVTYLASIALGGTAQWLRLQVPAATPSFLDMRSITTGWECQQRGIDPLAANPCDPSPGRPATRPRIWQLPGHLGLGESLTVPLGVANGLLFFAAVLLFLGPLGLWEGIVVAMALCSPAVMLGVERGNVDLVSIAVLAVAIVLLRRPAVPSRLVAHGLFLLSAVLKIFPVFAFVVLARQERRWRLAAAAVGVLFALYVALTLGDLLTIRRVYPRDLTLAYGAGVLGDGTGVWLANHVGWLADRSSEAGALLTRAAIAAGIAGGAWLGLRFRRRLALTHRDFRFDGFLAGAAMYLGTYVLLHEFDYRLACLVLVLPQFFASIRRPEDRTMATLGLANVMLVLLLAARVPGSPPYEEVLNWLLFVYFVAVIVGTLGEALRRRRDLVAAQAVGYGAACSSSRGTAGSARA